MGFKPYSTNFEIKQQHSTLYRSIIVTALIIILYLGMLFGSLTLFVNKFLYFLLMSSQDFWENLWHQISFLFVSIQNNCNNEKFRLILHFILSAQTLLHHASLNCMYFYYIDIFSNYQLTKCTKNGKEMTYPF